MNLIIDTAERIAREKMAVGGVRWDMVKSAFCLSIIAIDGFWAWIRS